MNNAEPVIFGENHLRIEDLLATLGVAASRPRALTWQGPDSRRGEAPGALRGRPPARPRR